MDSLPEIPEETKRCSKCGEVKPATREYFRKHNQGLRPDCIDCNKEYFRQYYIEHGDKIRGRVSLYREQNLDKVTERENEYRSSHREQARARTRQWSSEHPDRVKEYQRKYSEVKAEEKRAYSREWYRKNSDRYPEYKRRRRAQKAKLPFSFTIEDENRALDYWHGRCAVCGRPLRDLFGEHTAAMDHWIPINDPRPDNPGTVPLNMVPLCHGIDGCNTKKNDTDPIIWLNGEFGAKKAQEIICRIEKFFEWVKNQSP